jgi:hypothetical protein
LSLAIVGHEMRPLPHQAPTGPRRTGVSNQVNMGSPVSVVDVDMTFGSMVPFMVKWAIASIPAVLILSFILGVIAVALAMALAPLGMFARGLR